MKKPTTSTPTERPPIVVIMGHIDHGKSTLLDYIRKSNVTAGEAGGITQHTSAYEVAHKTPSGAEKRITFLDTPGHEAFSSMRSRGAKVADVAILVVSGVEGIQVQSLEALRAIQAAGIPYIVAINKIDKPEADIERTKQILAQNEIFVENYGGTIPCVPISAKTGTGIPDLLDIILLVAELGELKADSNKPGEGVVIEAHLDPKRGASATLIVKDGTLSKGMFLVIEGVITPVRIMESFAGGPLSEATFSSPVKIAGLTSIPAAGAVFASRDTKKEAEAFAEEEQEKAQTKKAERERISAADEVGKAIVPILIKADTLGTLEALEKELEKLRVQFKETIIIKIVQAGAGPITENDVRSVSGVGSPVIVGFNVKIDRAAQDMAERMGVMPKSFRIIYEVQKYLEDEIKARVPKVEKEVTKGVVKILRVFSQTRDKQIIGGGVTSGSITLNADVKVMRQNHEIGRGFVAELQERKAKTKEVVAGNQFGAMIESKMTIAEGDILEIVERVTE